MLCLIYTHDVRGRAAPNSECVYIRQSMSACVITNVLHFTHSKICPNRIFKAPLFYIVTDSTFDCGMLWYGSSNEYRIAISFSIAIF